MKRQVEGQLTLFLADFHASPFPLPGNEEARRMTAISGQKWLGLSRNCGPLGLLEKTLLESCEWHSPTFYLNWKPVDIGQGRFLFQLALSEPGIEDTGSQLLDTEPTIWKTPIVSDAANRKMYANSRGEPNLSGQVKLWPTPKMYNTPTFQDAKNSTLPESQMKRDSLVGDVIKEMFPTPTAQDYKRRGPGSRQQGLPEKIAMFPTPTVGASLCGGTGNFRQMKKLEENGVISEEERRNMSQGNGGQLNPDWVEWLMGFPIGWTDIGT